MAANKKIFTNKDGSYNLDGLLIKSTRLRMRDMQNVTKVGEGTQGEVYFARNTFLGDIAIKEFPRPLTPKNMQDAVQAYTTAYANLSRSRELKFASEVDNHPNITRFYGYVVSDNSEVIDQCNIVGIITEYMENGSLDYFLSSHPEKATPLLKWKWALQLARALAYCHDVHNIVHRDVKLDNCLLNSQLDLKLCDFGFARVPLEGDMTTLTGTLNYIAPEVIWNEGRNYSYKADVWSYGMFLYALTHNVVPFGYIPAIEPFRQKLVKGDRPIYNPELLNIFPFILSEIMFECWELEPDARPTMKEIVLKMDENKFCP